MEQLHIESRAGQIYGFIGGFFSLATIAISLRLYSRLRLAHVGWDDLTITFAYVGAHFTLFLARRRMSHPRWLDSLHWSGSSQHPW